MEKYKNDSDKVVKLYNNYRCHELILHISNTRFYGERLQAKAQPETVDFALNWEIPGKTEAFPILVQNINQLSENIDGKIWFNMGEVKAIRWYVDLLLKQQINGRRVSHEHIGIMTAYNGQLEKIIEEFKNDKGIEMGTVEYFQGREKNIIILSTVKSGYPLGFLEDERRTNVALTCAKGFLIIVTNISTIRTDCHWNALIEFCEENGGISETDEKEMVRFLLSIEIFY